MSSPVQSNPIHINGARVVEPQSNPIYINGTQSSPPIPMPPNERHNRIAQMAAQNNAFRAEHPHSRPILQGIAAHRRDPSASRNPLPTLGFMVTVDPNTHARVVLASPAPPPTSGVDVNARTAPLSQPLLPPTVGTWGIGRVPPPDSTHHR